MSVGLPYLRLARLAAVIDPFEQGGQFLAIEDAVDRERVRVVVCACLVLRHPDERSNEEPKLLVMVQYEFASLSCGPRRRMFL